MANSTAPGQSEHLSMKRYSGHLPASPLRVSESGSVGLHTEGDEALSSHDLLVRPPWTPPPSPSLVAQAPGQIELPVVGLASENLICDGRRYVPLNPPAEKSFKLKPFQRCVSEDQPPDSLRGFLLLAATFCERLGRWFF